ncbi:hypothetical protein VAPA_2c11920 [Variovorax paradoxus B4]|uniref:Uncharacterized protein n=1 Tax=Variovorax paradoxus B4 TaxID=1246301 RepID=T1XMH4_VARPD|nr:hypothetical protein VAPA_2c11920 [Variovorax paradoxus B4]
MSAFKGLDVWQHLWMSLNPLLAQVRRYGARADDALDCPEFRSGLQQAVRRMHCLLARGRLRLPSFDAPLLLNCRNEFASGSLKWCS